MPLVTDKLQRVPGFEHGRPETGPMQFGDDWPGVFIRGDNALMAYAPAVRMLLKHPDEMWAKPAVEGLLRLLLSCNVQRIREREEAP